VITCNFESGIKGGKMKKTLLISLCLVFTLNYFSFGKKYVCPTLGHSHLISDKSVRSLLKMPNENDLKKPKIRIDVYYSQKRSKFSSYAFQREGVLIDAVEKDSRYNLDKKYSGVIAEIYNKDNLKELRHFIEEGGRAVLFICNRDAKYNSEFQEIFSISIYTHYFIIGIKPTEKTMGKRMPIKGDDYCPLFKGLTLMSGAITTYKLQNWDWNSSAIRSSLFVDKSVNWVTHYMIVKGKKIYLSAWRKLGKGEVLFLVTFDNGFSCTNRLISDSDIEAGQNLEASMRLVRWLIGKIEYPKR
jgi:hypothetical protein